MDKLTSTIGDALFTKTQQRVLALLYGKSEQSYYLNELVRLVDMGKGTVKRELEKLHNAGLVTVRRQGNQNHYQANPDNPIFSELKGIIHKTFGVVDILKIGLTPIMLEIELAFVYGSIAKGSENAGSDIDVMLVGNDLSYSEVMNLLDSAEEQLGRKINPTILTVDEFQQRLTSRQNFLKQVLKQSKLWLKRDKLKLIPEKDFYE